MIVIAHYRIGCNVDGKNPAEFKPLHQPGLAMVEATTGEFILSARRTQRDTEWLAVRLTLIGVVSS
jgi:hypothetical protein